MKKNYLNGNHNNNNNNNNGRRTIENERNAFVAKNNCLSRLCLFSTLFFNFF